MAKKSEPLRIRVDGQVLVAVPEREYTALLVSRRQAGALAARVRMLQQALTEALAEPDPPDGDRVA
ncbi:hypothetical protein ACIRBX_24005 [Kitasatospora sp. NPDC096147]|uniref:hypothetical protein n=1 Tax=Kitasatospora sp. NPDC096147 TaxID=3364093 RepID=UPI0038061C90